MRTRTVLVVGVVTALLLAGVASFYASSSPDGLAGIVGALVVLALAGGLAMAVGMRGAKSGGRGERQREPEPSSRQQQGRLRRPSDRDRRTQRRTGER